MHIALHTKADKDMNDSQQEGNHQKRHGIGSLHRVKPQGWNCNIHLKKRLSNYRHCVAKIAAEQNAPKNGGNATA